MKNYIVKFVVVWFIICWVLIYFQSIDTTDIDKHNRSGMKLYIDNMTGCHYLEAGMIGGITPRLDRNGKQICDER